MVEKYYKGNSKHKDVETVVELIDLMVIRLRTVSEA